MEINKIKELVILESEKVDKIRLFFELRFLRVPNNKKLIEGIKRLLALQRLGIPINTLNVEFFLDRANCSALALLHNLGDRGILAFKRPELRSTEALRYCFSEWFLNRIYKE